MSPQLMVQLPGPPVVTQFPVLFVARTGAVSYCAEATPPEIVRPRPNAAAVRMCDGFTPFPPAGFYWRRVQRLPKQAAAGLLSSIHLNVWFAFQVSFTKRARPGWP